MIDARAPVETFDEIDSTLLEARRRAERGEIGPVWLVAKTQTAGRGRRGRAWVSYEGNLLATYLFSTRRSPGEIALLGFATGVSLAETVDAALGARRSLLKWPNDLLVDDAKCAGLMLDSGALGGGVAWVALAFGVNLAHAPEGIDQAAVSLRALLPPDAPAPRPLEFLAALRPRLEAWSARLEGEGFEPLRHAWLSRAYGLGRRARVLQGDLAVEGVIAGLSARGELELDTDQGLRMIAAGEVLFSSES